MDCLRLKNVTSYPRMSRQPKWFVVLLCESVNRQSRQDPGDMNSSTSNESYWADDSSVARSR
jgi:hypothetical protein